MQTALLLDMAAEAMPDRFAIGPLAQALSLTELRRRAWAAAAFLGDHAGQTIAFLGENSASLPVAIFAAGYDGRPFAPLNYRLPDDDLNRLVARTAPSVLIVDDDMRGRLAAAPGVEVVDRSAFDHASMLPVEDAPRAVREPEVAVLLFTSGTTGEPKAAVLRHSNLTSYVISTVDFMGSEDGETALVSVPPYHIAGISAVLTGIYGGRRIVHLQAFTPEAWIEAAERERVTHAMVVPTMLGRILDILESRGETLPNLRALSYGGGRMPLTVIERAMLRMPHVGFVNAYGLTETSSTIALLDADDHRAAQGSHDPAVRRRLGSVGRPLPTIELEVRDPHGASVNAGVVGEVWVRGEQVSGEYVGRKTARDDGWFRTNDSGWLDKAGYLFVEGRLDDVIVRGGENISPGEVEDVLRRHPDVADVAVFGAPDNEWGEKVVAVVVPLRPVAAEALKAHVRSGLRSTKSPALVLFRDALPYNDMGKLLRRVLRAEFIDTVTEPA
jgi:fatty-acyl-CoA synthase